MGVNKEDKPEATREEVLSALRSMKRGKAPELDGVVVGLLLDAGDLVLSWLVELVARVKR